MKKIELTQGKYAIVDDNDYEWLNQWKWHANGVSKFLYAARRDHSKGGKGKSEVVIMHRLILGLKKGDKRHGDHIDGNGLNNQRSNLRIADKAQNGWNSPGRGGSSKYKGVSYVKRIEKWAVSIRHSGIGKGKSHLGNFKTEEEAAKAYDEAAKELHGEFAYLNFPKHPKYSTQSHNYN